MVQTTGNHDGLGFQDPHDFSRAQDLLRAAQYTDAGIKQFAGSPKKSPPIAQKIPPFLLEHNSGTTLETLIRLFLLNISTEEKTTQRAFTSMTLETWCEAGLLQIHQGRVFPLVTIVPYQGLWIASDLAQRAQGSEAKDFVMGIGGSTLAIIRATIRRSFRQTLDLGTGTGLQALLAATHSESATAIDCNPRALMFAKFNARLNGVTNLKWHQGDMLDLGMEGTFDLVVSNPPFVISPDCQFQYRDSGKTGDHFCQQLVQQIPKYLHEGGYGQIICNWAHVKGQKWQERLAHWLRKSGCDVWVMRTSTRSPSDYTRFWNQKNTLQTGWPERYKAWMAYYEQERIEAISTGLITMRRSSDHTNWFRAEDVPPKVVGSLGEEIHRGFELFDFLDATQKDESLLNSTLNIAPDLQLDHQYHPSTQGWQFKAGRLTRTRGRCYSIPVDPDIANLVLKCNGQYPLKDVLSQLPTKGKQSTPTRQRQYLQKVRHLIGRGFLLPTSTQDPQPSHSTP